MKINVKRVHKFMRSISDAERIYAKHVMDISQNIRDLIKTYDLSDDRVCDLFDIELYQLKDFKAGAHNYDLRDVSALNAAHVQLGLEAKTKELEENTPVEITK